MSLFPEELIVSVLDAFIVNRPMSGKVGGDGFWVYQEGDDFYLAVFDCMGHGHLASMMTRIYTQTFQRIVQKDEVKDPGTILRYLHHKMDHRFRGKDNMQVGSGADVGLLKINLGVRKMEYAGAKMDLTHVRDGALGTIKADRMPIGELFEYNHDYHTRTVHLSDDTRTWFYLMSDGFKDLMGGPNGKKLGRKGVQEVLQQVNNRSSVDQREYLLGFLDEWSGSNMQLDDVLVIGFAL